MPGPSSVGQAGLAPAAWVAGPAPGQSSWSSIDQPWPSLFLGIYIAGSKKNAADTKNAQENTKH